MDKYRILKQLGIYPNNSGYRLLTEIITMVEQDKEVPLKKHYQKLAERFCCTPNNIEKKISWCIEKGIARASEEYFKLFGMSIEENKAKPTNKQFIYTIIDKNVI